jgi:hypothetical protein
VPPLPPLPDWRLLILCVVLGLVVALVIAGGFSLILP